MKKPDEEPREADVTFNGDMIAVTGVHNGELFYYGPLDNMPHMWRFAACFV